MSDAFSTSREGIISAPSSVARRVVAAGGAWQEPWRAYLDHAVDCPACGAAHCETGKALYETYRAAGPR